MFKGAQRTKNVKPGWIIGWLPTRAGFFPKISTRLSREDILGGWRVRWGFSRMNYQVSPGLYGVGKPGADSPVLVTANYKLSFDSLRKHLEGINAWIVVLDTKGVNVWCSAGKGTFGTEELVGKIESLNLSALVRHRNVILPQLAAPGVAAHVVTRTTGFKVLYGPVRAADLPMYLKNGCQADRQMRTVTFTTMERLAVIPVEVILSWKIALAALAYHLLAQYLSGHLSSWSTMTQFLPYLGAILAGCVLTPMLLPWIPGPSLAWKGWLVGISATLAFALINEHPWLVNTTYLLILPAISAFLAFNFTGCTTYTSLSGVKKEMRIALPLIIFSAALGIVVRFVYMYVWRTPWQTL
ncbi:MAG: Corrinoid/iron-sulfur protein large subunit [Syntrophorhabdus sp. PtaU1.Bin153]|nr:MAG: Corrinoid/iron-sulfur protein large subunit [Syntrophorhabdus sp. PtaU1.Bin153]